MESSKAPVLFLQTGWLVFTRRRSFLYGTREIWRAIAESKGHSVIGGGDTVSSASSKFIDFSDIGVCTAGGAMVRFMSGKKAALIDAMERGYAREYGG